MCLAIYKPAGKDIKKQWLQNGYDGNPHGAGFAWAENNQVHIEKGFFDFEEFYDAYSAHAHLGCVVHFRFATHGEMNEFNCHPWDMCAGEYAVVHNGIINIQSTDDMSDTGHFVKLVLEPAARRLGVESPVLKYLIETSVGHSNKLVVLHPTGKATFFNEKEGMWVDGVWFSNTGYQTQCGKLKFSSGFDYIDWSGKRNRKAKANREEFAEYRRFDPDVEADIAYWMEMGYSREEAVEWALSGVGI